jgi:hypothetical protein
VAAAGFVLMGVMLVLWNITLSHAHVIFSLIGQHFYIIIHLHGARLHPLSRQRLADTLETKEEELQRMDHDLSVKVQDLLKENAALRNQVADLKEEGVVGRTAVIGVENDKINNPSLPMSHTNPLSKFRKDQQRTPATSCDLTSGEEEFDCELTIVHLLASHCSVVSSSSRQVIPSPPFTSSQRFTACTGHSRKLPKVRELRLVSCRGVGRRSSRGGRRPLAWIYSPFIPRRIITTKEPGNDGVSDLSSCM